MLKVFPNKFWRDPVWEFLWGEKKKVLLKIQNFLYLVRDFNSACKRCNLMKTDEIKCDAGANSTNSRVEVMQNAAKIS